MKKLLIAVVILAAFILSPLSEARATILFAGGEDSDFTSVGSVAVTTASTWYSSGYAREALYITNGGTVTSGIPQNYILTPAFTSNSVVWIHANTTNNGADTSNQVVISASSPDGYPRIQVRSTGTTGEWKISKIDQSAAYTDLVTMSSPCFGGSTLRTIDLYINYGTSGEVTLYCNGTSYADYTGNVTTNSATQINQVLFSGPFNLNYIELWSEVIVATTDTRNMRLATLSPSANGNTHTFDTGAASNVNETTLNNSTVDASGTSAQIQEYTVGSLPTGTFNVLDLRLSGQAQVGTTGPQHLQAMVRTGSTDYTSSNLSPPVGSWGYISNDWTTNPNTGVAWTTSDLAAAGFNIGFKSQN